MQEAMKWNRLAAEQGYRFAQCSVALWCDNGEGIEEDLQSVVRWYRLKAEEGDRDKQFQFGLKYQSGHGVGKISKKQ